MESVIIFKKAIKKKEGGTFDKYFAKLPNSNRVIDVNITKEFEKQVLLSGVNFPLCATFNDSDEYFIKSEGYLNKENVKLYKDVLVVLRATGGIVKAEFEKRTLTDLDRSYMNQAPADDEMPFNQ